MCPYHPEWLGIKYSILGDSVKRIVISAFLLFHILAITLWCVPLDTLLVGAFRDAVRPYMLWTGLFQSWDMFAPTPRSFNAWVEASVIFRDGRIQPWRFPRMEQLSLTDRYYKERYRKFVENLQEDKQAALWPDVARHIARLNNNPANPPEIVMLIRYWSEIVPRADGSYHPEPVRGHILFEYNVKPRDLQ
jgi:hypothetical protein